MATSQSKADARRFFVTATSNIGDTILKGDHLLIDPDARPEIGKWVLIGDRASGHLERWNEQPAIGGVAVQVSRPIGVVVGRFTDEEANHG